MGTENDVEKCHRFQDRMSETLEFNGLGSCDDGSIETGSTVVRNYVIDVEVAKKIIESELKGTEFENYTRIFDEGGINN